jgi:hypothetical protein
MSFREKSAWITLITLIVASAFVVTHLPPPWSLAPEPSVFRFHVLGVAIAAFIVIEIVAHVVVAIRAPREANAPADERERLIGLKATRAAAYVYAVLTLSSIFLIHLGANEIGLALFILLSFVIAEIVNYTARIVYYRRGV